MSRAFKLGSPLPHSRPGLSPCLRGAEARPPLLPSQGRVTASPAAELLELGCPLLGPVPGGASGQSGFLFPGESPSAQVASCQSACACACRLERLSALTAVA